MKLKDIGEFGFIDKIKNGCLIRTDGVVQAIGDDAAAFVSAEGKLTLVTTDGWEFPNVEVELLATGDRLRVMNASGAEKILPVSLVRSLRDASGRDVTAQVLKPPGVAQCFDHDRVLPFISSGPWAKA